jgi:hypothetical protein
MMTSNSPAASTAPASGAGGWRALTPTLWRLYAVYLTVWLFGMAVFVRSAMANDNMVLAGIALFASVPLYVVCLVYAGRIQSSMHREGRSKSGVVPIVIAGMVLNPLFLGFYVPLSVLLSARRASRQS